MKKLLYLTLLILALPLCLMADWRMELYVLNYNAAATDSLLNWASLGEKSTAQEGYDMHDLIYNIPPMGNRYVVPYFRHNDWGANSGNFSVDIRSTVPATKIWESTVRAQNPYTNSFTLRWQLSLGEIPAYYTPILIFGQNQINMRTQHSFTYTSAASLTNFQIQLTFDPQMPYITQPIADIVFTGNSPTQIPLHEHFAVNSGTLSYSFMENESIQQELVVEAGSSYWVLQPTAGWIGTESLTITAHNANKSISQAVQVSRDTFPTLPDFPQALPHLEIFQNSALDWYWGALLAEGAGISLVAEATAALALEIDNSQQTLRILPVEGFKGDTMLPLQLSDGVNLSPYYHLEINVLPATPQPAQNFKIHTVGDSLYCVWDAVNLDINGKAIGGVYYDLYQASTPDFSAGATRVALDLSEPYLMLPLIQERAFYRVIAKNP